MLNLMKYEFRKNNIVIGILAGIGVFLQIGYFILYAAAHGTGRKALAAQQNMVLMIVFLTLLLTIGFFVVFILGIVNYKNELNSKSSYLIFMTPNSSLKIILSKLLYIFLVEVVFLAALSFLIGFDIIQSTAFLDDRNMIDLVMEFFEQAFDINLKRVWTEVLLSVVSFVIGFFAIMVMAYCAITLSATFLYNSRWKGFVSVVLFIVICIAVSYVDNHFVEQFVQDVDIFTVKGRVMYLLPNLIYYLFIMTAGVFGCSKLIDKAINL